MFIDIFMLFLKLYNYIYITIYNYIVFCWFYFFSRIDIYNMTCNYHQINEYKFLNCFYILQIWIWSDMIYLNLESVSEFEFIQKEKCKTFCLSYSWILLHPLCQEKRNRDPIYKSIDSVNFLEIWSWSWKF